LAISEERSDGDKEHDQRKEREECIVCERRGEKRAVNFKKPNYAEAQIDAGMSKKRFGSVHLYCSLADAGLIQYPDQHPREKLPHSFVLPEDYLADFLWSTFDCFPRRGNRGLPLSFGQFPIFIALFQYHACEWYLHLCIEAGKVILAALPQLLKVLPYTKPRLVLFGRG
jgi:hypothetical protein